MHETLVNRACDDYNALQRNLLRSIEDDQIDEHRIHGIDERVNNPEQIQDIRYGTLVKIHQAVKGSRLTDVETDVLHERIIFETYADQTLDSSRISTAEIEQMLQKLFGEDEDVEILLGYFNALEDKSIFRTVASSVLMRIDKPLKIHPIDFIFRCEFERNRGAKDRATKAALTSLLLYFERNDVLQNGNQSLSGIQNRKINEYLNRGKIRRASARITGKSLRGTLAEYTSMRDLAGNTSLEDLRKTFRKKKTDMNLLPVFIMRLRKMLDTEMACNPRTVEETGVLIKNLEILYLEHTLSSRSVHTVGPQTVISKTWNRIEQELGEAAKLPLRGEKPPEEPIWETAWEALKRWLPFLANVGARRTRNR